MTQTAGTKKTKAIKKAPPIVETVEPTAPDHDMLTLAELLESSNEAPVEGADLLSSLLEEGVAQTEKNSQAETLPEPKVEAATAIAPEAKPAAAKTEKPAAPARPPVHAKTSEKIAHRLGEKASNFLVLELSDVGGTETELAKQQAAIMAQFDAMGQIKVREKAVQLFGFMSNGGKLNEVMRRAFTVLIKEGQLTSGDKGNLQLDLLKKPYSLGTARAQAGQIFSLFPALKIVNKADRGIYKANEESTVLAFMKSHLGL